LSAEVQYGGPGFDVVERARDTIESHSMVSPGDSILVAVSGGPDSTCLLDVLARLGTKMDLALEVAHVDHGLDARSAAVASRVSTAAAEAGYDVHLMRVEELEGPNIQAKARELRYRFFDSVARRIDADHIATGHTLDDRVETTLGRLIHGAATEGLAGIPPVEGPRIRPLIDVRRERSRSYCAERDLEFVDDPANEDDAFERVAIRKRLVKAIEDRWGPGAIEAIATSSDRLLADGSALRDISERLYSEMARGEEDGVSFDRAALAALAPALRRRLFERAVGRVRDRSGGIDAAVAAINRGPDGDASFSVAGGTVIEASSDRVFVRREGAEGAES
jgi:tRNA(Ile)-lysidine synthase